MLHRDRRYFSSMSFAFEREVMYAREAWSRSEESEARYAREAWSRSEGRSTALEQVMTLQTQHDRM
ncbi:hypothetical protein Tco_0444366, partial [Tanacetum coccineum]